MAWVRIDDEFYSHPKVAALRSDVMLACIGLHTLALCWCNHKLTDGRIPLNQVHRLAGDLSLALPSGNPHALINELLRVGMWEPLDEDSYQIHDYLDYQPSRAQIQAVREAKSEAGKKGMRSRWGDREPAADAPSITPVITPDIAPAITPDITNRYPVPVPVPIPKEEGGTSHAREDTPPVDDSEPEDDFRRIEVEDDDLPEDHHTEAQKLTGFYVNEHARLGRSKPTRRQTGIVAQVIGEKLGGGAEIEHVREAMRRLVEKGKAPSILPAMVSEVEAEGTQRARAAPRNTFPDPGPPMTPEQRTEALRAAQEGRKKLEALGQTVGRTIQ